MSTVASFVFAPTKWGQKPSPLAPQDLQTTLVGIMGHDLRQSLQVIEGTYALLRSRSVDGSERAWLDRGERAVTRLTEQLNCLVDAFYLAERSNTPEISSVGLGPLLRQLRYENEDAALQRGIELRVASTGVSVASNTVLLGCILSNLLTNAIKYTNPGGRILLGCRRKAFEIRIDVFDTGVGIPRTQLPRIFDSYTRLAPEHGDGLGIGLSITRRAVEALGHRIEVRSVVGQGSLFSIYAPLSVASGT